MSKRQGHWYEQSLRELPGEEGRFWRLVYGKDEAHFGEIVAHESHRRPGVFNRKLDKKGHLKVVRPSRDADE